MFCGGAWICCGCLQHTQDSPAGFIGKGRGNKEEKWEGKEIVPPVD